MNPFKPQNPTDVFFLIVIVLFAAFILRQLIAYVRRFVYITPFFVRAAQWQKNPVWTEGDRFLYSSNNGWKLCHIKSDKVNSEGQVWCIVDSTNAKLHMPISVSELYPYEKGPAELLFNRGITW